MIVLLDAGPLGLVTNPRGNAESQQCKQWLVALLAQSVRVLVPEITDAVILAQQEADTVVIATTNVAHLSRFVAAPRWQDIQAPTP